MTRICLETPDIVGGEILQEVMVDVVLLDHNRLGFKLREVLSEVNRVELAFDRPARVLRTRGEESTEGFVGVFEYASGRHGQMSESHALLQELGIETRSLGSLGGAKARGLGGLRDCTRAIVAG